MVNIQTILRGFRGVGEVSGRKETGKRRKKWHVAFVETICENFGENIQQKGLGISLRGLRGFALAK
jgi:hypothetical protein